MLGFGLASWLIEIIVFDKKNKFRILCDEEISVDVRNYILKKDLDTESNFKPYCDNYVIKIEKQSVEDFNELMIEGFSVFQLNTITN